MIEVEDEVNSKTNKRIQYLIDRDNLIKLAKSHKNRMVDANDIARVSVVYILRHGHWVAERDPYGDVKSFHCSECYDDTGFFTLCTSEYCPKCGCRLDGDIEKVARAVTNILTDKIKNILKDE